MQVHENPDGTLTISATDPANVLLVGGDPAENFVTIAEVTPPENGRAGQ